MSPLSPNETCIPNTVMGTSRKRPDRLQEIDDPEDWFSEGDRGDIGDKSPVRIENRNPSGQIVTPQNAFRVTSDIASKKNPAIGKVQCPASTPKSSLQQLDQAYQQGHRNQIQNQRRNHDPEQDRQHGIGSAFSTVIRTSCFPELPFQNLHTATPKPRSLLC